MAVQRKPWDCFECPKKKVITINMGEFYASREPEVIYTLLGSCIAVCLFDPVQKIGGMNHFLLPGEAHLGQFNNSARYGINAMEHLINRIVELGGVRKRLQAKLFGGGHVLAVVSKEYGVGDKNIKFAREYLANEKIRIISEDVAGEDTRRIYLEANSFNMFLKRSRASDWVGVAETEKKRIAVLKKKDDGMDNVTLF